MIFSSLKWFFSDGNSFRRKQASFNLSSLPFWLTLALTTEENTNSFPFLSDTLYIAIRLSNLAAVRAFFFFFFHVSIFWRQKQSLCYHDSFGFGRVWKQNETCFHMLVISFLSKTKNATINKFLKHEHIVSFGNISATFKCSGVKSQIWSFFPVDTGAGHSC